jgi:hypothetical protein
VYPRTAISKRPLPLAALRLPFVCLHVAAVFAGPAGCTMVAHPSKGKLSG